MPDENELLLINALRSAEITLSGSRRWDTWFVRSSGFSVDRASEVATRIRSMTLANKRRIWYALMRMPPPDDVPLTKDQEESMKRGLSLLSPFSVAEQYRRAYEECRMSGARPPKASAIQSLVAAWYQLWKWQK